MELTERKLKILQAIISDYVKTAETGRLTDLFLKNMIWASVLPQ